MISMMVRVFVGPNNGESMQTANVFVEYTGRVIGISAFVLPEVEKKCASMYFASPRCRLACVRPCLHDANFLPKEMRRGSRTLVTFKTRFNQCYLSFC